MKKCSECKTEKDVSEFYRDGRKEGEYRAACKECTRKKGCAYGSLNKQKRRDYYQKNKEKIDNKKQEYAEKNKEKILEYQREYRKKNKEKISLNKKKYYLENKERIEAYKKEKYEQNKEPVLEYQRKYRKKHNDRILAQKKEYYEDRKDEIINYSRKARRAKVSYEVYANKLTVNEASKPDNEGKLLVLCTYCGRYHYPNRGEVQRRLVALRGKSGGEHRLYCSESCKIACPVFGKISWPAGYKPATSREVQPQLRQMRLALDDYECQKCGVSIEDSELHCHHYTGTVQNPIESADVDNTVTVCKKCHKWVHTQEGCRYFELRCK